MRDKTNVWWPQAYEFSWRPIAGCLPPLDRDSDKWERESDHRTAVERVNSRLDVSFGFEVHTVRGLKKMRMRSGLALIVMLAMALGRIRQQHPEHVRSVVWSA